MATRDDDAEPMRSRPIWRIRAVFVLFILMAVSVVWITNHLLTQRFTESTRARAEVRLALYSGNLISELRRNSVVPLLLSRDPTLIGALNAGDFSQSSQRLIEYKNEIGAASIQLLDADGRVVAATNRNELGASHRSAPYYVNALRSNDTVFTTFKTEAGATSFSYARRIDGTGKPIGVIVVGVDLAKFEESWAGISDAVMVTNSQGQVILATESSWRGLTVEEALAKRDPPSAIERALRATAQWAALPVEAYFTGDAVMQQEAQIKFHGWRMTSYTTYASVRDWVNAVIALEIMVFSLLLAAAFYFVSRRAQSRSALFQRESAELRRLNKALQREIAERERAEKNLEVAEQSLQQSSKLAILGEMSAAVSHELNQPLAAMKTYLAGARLLLQRKRPDEALSSFHRIDGLIERMTAITRQLKSYARKGGDAFEPMDARACVSGALELMEPQLKSRAVKVTLSMPRDPVTIVADRLRLEQVLINLLRNAIDATRNVAEPKVDILLSAGKTVLISVRDNGHGIDDLDALFEPFYTTKSAGDGVGLGLAISSGIVNDLGGRLSARNGRASGAVFEIRLPVHDGSMEAAE